MLGRLLVATLLAFLALALPGLLLRLLRSGHPR